jgi:AcrR family transcriptional regulator
MDDAVEPDRPHTPAHPLTPREPPRPATRAPSALPDEIVRRSIGLFNRDGPENVSTNLIAADLGISSGNLHYHFRTKKDLSRALFAVLETDLRRVLRTTDSPATVPHIVARQIEVQRCLWRHRYFFAGLDAMVRKDEDLLRQFQQLHGWVIEQIIQLLDHYISAMGLRTIEAPNSSRLVAQNTWMLWMSWVRWEVLTGGKAEADAAHRRAVIHRLVGHHFSFLAVLMPRDLAEDVSRQLDAALL